MAPAPAKTPKSEVNDWCLFQTEGAQKVVYLTEGDDSKPPTYQCTLKLPDGREFQSEGGYKKKKDAEQAAAEKAMQAIGRPNAEPEGTSPVLPVGESAFGRWQLLKSRLEASLADKSVAHFSPLSPFFSTAALTGRPIPLAVLAQVDNRIAAAIRGLHPQAETDPLQGLALMAAAVRACEGVRLTKDGLGPWPESPTARARTEAQEPASSPPGVFRAVFLPQDKERPPADVTLPRKPGGAYLEQIAEVLGLGDANRVLISRTVGKSGSNLRIYSLLTPLPTAHVSDDGSFTFLPAGSDERKGGADVDFPESLTGVETGSAIKKINGHDCDNERSGSSESNERNGSGDRNERNGWNERASWGAGHAVFGDAVVASVGTTYSSLGKLTWDDVSTRDWHSLLLSRHPRGMYQLSRGAPLAATLPRTYAGSGRWEGKTPKTLLFDLGKPKCSGAGDKVPVYTLSKKGEGAGENEPQSVGATEGEPGLGVMRGRLDWVKVPCRLEEERRTEVTGPPKLGSSLETVEAQSSLQPLTEAKTESCPERERKDEPGWEAEVEFVYGHQAMRASSGGRWESPGDAENAAALAGLHVVQALFDARVLTREAAKEEGKMGDLSNSEHDGTAIIDYKIVSGGTVLEENRGFLVPRGTGAVLPQIEQCIDTCQQGETRSVQMRALASWQPLITATCLTEEPLAKPNDRMAASEPQPEESESGDDVTIEVRLCGHVEPREQRLEGALFTPSLASQRMDFALTVLEQCKAASVLDLGCGSGAFLEAVAERATCVQRLAGADVSERALARARKAVHAKLEKRGTAGALAEKDVEIIGRSMLDLDERFAGWDLATCIEVVEHLDPEPLAGFGPAVLGRLRPKVLLVSTPNVEYNPVLQAAATGTRRSDANEGDEPCRLRNEDHRFEWTRAEFRTWAVALAAEYGYSVEYSGVGGDGAENGPGFCTQIAVFRRISKCVGDS
ncbi:double-stranded RNA binding protein-related methyltransferase [Klebsormidium nitens]|uniref:Small RNA 2'-O-methyltransferase n=1 Tax=Klebsormidium nitens TaxID=105231 RepID=A0A1Y1HSN7_KLENI|nr:double-stranded RNA binding protein-related methyltransferase [Klebsormidium nitens]|eukprot:GAQ79576.1 double-stranded RNA binding protein-related methyltransferase [Klebsormidium nitens]